MHLNILQLGSKNNRPKITSKGNMHSLSFPQPSPYSLIALTVSAKYRYLQLGRKEPQGNQDGIRVNLLYGECQILGFNVEKS